MIAQPVLKLAIGDSAFAQRPADYESRGSSSMACDNVIFQLHGSRTLSMRYTPANQKHSCWLSAWLSNGDGWAR